MDNSQYLSMFLAESEENLQTLNVSLLQLEKQPSDKKMLESIFRVAHTLKGMSATMGYSNVATLTHNMEDVLTKVKNNEISVSETVVTVLFSCLDKLERMIEEIASTGKDDLNVDSIISELKGLNNLDTQIQEVKEEFLDRLVFDKSDLFYYEKARVSGDYVFKLSVDISKDCLMKNVRALIISTTLREHSIEVIKSAPDTESIENDRFGNHLEFVCLSKDESLLREAMETISELDAYTIEEIKTNDTVETLNTISVENEVSDVVKDTSIQETEQTAQPQKKQQSFVRVGLDKLDRQLNLASELVMHKARLTQIGAERQIPELSETLEGISRAVSELQDLVLQVRMIPIESVFSRFPRLIRDLKVSLGKDMELVIKGEDTELDRIVVEEIGEPLVHLIRNAADHGIESPDVRKSNGKVSTGTITLSAYQEGNRAVIKISDDGAGISVEKVKAKAEKQGIKVEGLSDSEIKNLIFANGFSTAEVVTDISGRGVGMDVVKTKIHSLGGTVEVESELGVGSTFIIKLPLTLQIIQSLLLEVAKETFIVSLGSVNRILSLKDVSISNVSGREVGLLSDNSIISLTRLSEKLGLVSSVPDSNASVVIINTGSRIGGLIVDAVLGQQEIVIKSLGKLIDAPKEFIGATILGNGRVTLILDVAEIL